MAKTRKNRIIAGRWNTLSLRGAAWRAAVLALLAVMGRAISAQAPEPIDMSKGCLASECHGEMQKMEFLHGPMNLKQCEPCHVPVNNEHVFEQTESPKALCLTCHSTEAPKNVVHAPFEADCFGCHDAHGSDNRYFVKGGLGAEGCNLCHTDVREGLAKLHGPVALGECLACHSPHQSDHEHLLTDPPADLCMACHVDFKATQAGAVSIHKPMEGDCSGCHGAHGGADQYFTLAKGRDLCALCHEDFLKRMDAFKFPHSPKKEGQDCNHCHAAHSANQEKLLSQPPGDLCLGCHGEPVMTATRTLPDIKSQMANAKYLHGPLEQKNCNGCHEAHGADFPNILDKEFPGEFYAEFEKRTYNLCFDCHDMKLALAETGDVTEFRNGGKNLHFLHVNREKGRSCRACHHEHATLQPKLIRSDVPFGRWTMKLEYTKTETGGGCLTGCHLPYKYDRVEIVDNSNAKVE